MVNSGNGIADLQSELSNLELINIKRKDDIIALVKFRNLLGHFYMEINNEKVYEIIQKDLDILTFFKKDIFTKFKNELKNGL